MSPHVHTAQSEAVLHEAPSRCPRITTGQYADSLHVHLVHSSVTVHPAVTVAVGTCTCTCVYQHSPVICMSVGDHAKGSLVRLSGDLAIQVQHVHVPLYRYNVHVHVHVVYPCTGTMYTCTCTSTHVWCPWSAIVYSMLGV